MNAHHHATKFSVLGPLTLALLLLVPAGASAQPLQLFGDDGDLRWTQNADGHGLVLEGLGTDPGTSTVDLPFAATARPLDLERQGDHWWALAAESTAQGPSLAVAAGRSTASQRLPSPGLRGERLVQGAALLAGESGLEAMVWLEGSEVRRLAVHGAVWTGESWGPTVDISPIGKGTQIALDARVLADGSWLAVWAAFDGSDDEILWSRAVDGHWSDPRPVTADNATPDITPRLFVTADGALLAWSHFAGTPEDGGYRIEVARFSDGRWTLPRTVAGRGSSMPRFLRHDQPVLGYQSAAPLGWGLLELGASGTVQRRAFVDIRSTDAPILVLDGRELTLAWRVFGEDGRAVKQQVRRAIPWQDATP